MLGVEVSQRPAVVTAASFRVTLVSWPHLELFHAASRVQVISTGVPCLWPDAIGIIVVSLLGKPAADLV